MSIDAILTLPTSWVVDILKLRGDLILEAMRSCDIRDDAYVHIRGRIIDATYHAIMAGEIKTTCGPVEYAHALAERIDAEIESVLD